MLTTLHRNHMTIIDRPTRNKIAAAAGCDERTVHAYIIGKRKPRQYLVDAIRKAAADLGVVIA